MRVLSSALLLALVSTSCAGASRQTACLQAQRKPRDEAREASEADRLAVFDALVARVHAAHQFSDAAFARRYQVEEQPGLARARWDADLPRFRRLFAEASTPEALAVVAYQLNESLLDGHCHFTPQQQSPARLLPLTFRPWLDGSYGRFVVRTSRVEGIEEGDELVALDGVAASELLAHEAFRTAATGARRRAEHIASGLSQGLMTTPSTQSQVTVVVSRGEEVITREVGFEGAPEASSSPSTDDAMTPQQCPAGNIDYGHGYRLASVGRKFCLYASTDAAFRDLPIVRYHSFMYTGSDAVVTIAADRDHLDQALLLAHASAPLRGLVLDLRENRGGVNPYLFQDFFTTQPYPHHIIEVPLTRAVHATRVLNPEEAAAYEAALREGESGFLRFPFLAPPEAMQTLHTPLRTLEVVRAGTPVALLSGHTCASSCDTLASWFARGQLGPVLGEEPALAFTTLRLPIELGVDGWGTIGTFHVAFSRETLGVDGPTVEGRVYPIQHVPETEENRAGYPALLLEAASATLPARRPR